MNKKVSGDAGRIVGAILAGCIGIVAVTFAFAPIIHLVLDNFLILDLSNNRNGKSTNIFVICLAISGWVFLPMLAGGYLAARIAKHNEYTIAWTIIGIVFVVSLFCFDASWLTVFPINLLLCGTSMLGAIVGCYLGIRYKDKKSVKT